MQTAICFALVYAQSTAAGGRADEGVALGGCRVRGSEIAHRRVVDIGGNRRAEKCGTKARAGGRNAFVERGARDARPAVRDDSCRERPVAKARRAALLLFPFTSGVRNTRATGRPLQRAPKKRFAPPSEG